MYRFPPSFHQCVFILDCVLTRDGQPAFETMYLRNGGVSLRSHYLMCICDVLGFGEPRGEHVRAAIHGRPRSICGAFLDGSTCFCAPVYAYMSILFSLWRLSVGTFGEVSFFFVSRRITSRIHETSDLKKALAFILRAEYTTFMVPKNTLNTRGMLEW